MRKDHTPDDLLENPEDMTPTPKANSPEASAAEQEAIFLEGLDGGTFGGKPLVPGLPFQYRRAAYAMGLRYGTLAQDEVEEAQKSGYYRGLDTDVIIVLWLRTQRMSEVMKALRLPDKALEKALEFGARYELEPGTTKFEAAAKSMQKAFEDLAKVRGRAEPADGKKAKKKSAPGN